LATNILRVFRHGAPEAAAARLRPRPQQSRRGHGGWSRPPVCSAARGATPVRVESAKQRANTPTYPCDTPLRALQLVRDSTLNGTNDYEIFAEPFEGLLYIGPYAKTLTLTICPNGESQIATDETGSLCSGS